MLVRFLTGVKYSFDGVFAITFVTKDFPMQVLFFSLFFLLAQSWLAPTYPLIIPCLPECPSWFALTPGWFLSNLL